MAEAVWGLTEFLHYKLNFPAHNTASRIDLFLCELNAHDGILAERSKKTSQRREMPDTNGIGLRLDDRWHSDCSEQRGAGSTF